MVRTTILPGSNVRSVLGEMKVEPWLTQPQHVGKPPFVTISRQPGAGGLLVGKDLVESLNKAGVAGGGWTLWDDELVAKVASDNNLTTELVRGLEYGQKRHSWLLDFMSSLPGEPGPPISTNEVWIYHRIADTIRSLAKTGRVVIVGHGSGLIARTIYGGVRARLVAPFEWRVNFISHHLGLAPRKARSWVRGADRHWDAFYRRFWRGVSLGPESYACTLNSSELSLPEMVDAIQAIVVRRLTPVPTGAAATSSATITAT